jgi:hypothetical protein
MRCIKCARDLASVEFYPNNAVCKDCITGLRQARLDKHTIGLERAERSQAAIREVVKQHQNGDPFVYLIEAASRYKIGYSTNIDRRIKTFNTANCVPCRIIAVAPGSKQLEKSLHQEFKRFRVNREWFINAPDILDAFAALPDAMIFLRGFVTQEGSTPSCRMDAS